MTYVGAPVRRREDRRLLTGGGAYAADVAAPGALHAAFVRSPYAHARIRGVDATAALALPGVRWVLTSADMPAGGHAPAPIGLPLPPDHPDRHLAPEQPLAGARVVYVGEPVALVIAEETSIARDGVELVQVEYDPLPVVADPAEALAPGSPLVHEELGTNLAFRYALGSPDIDAALAEADEVVRVCVRQPRLAGVALEPRATLVQYDPYTEGLVVWASTQGPHAHQHNLAASLGLPEHKLRVLTRDVGGGFGLKNMLYGDEAAVVYAAWTHRCSIRWEETRSESFQAMAHGRGMRADVALGVRRDGSFTGIRLDVLADMGGGVTHEGPIPPISLSTHAAGPYRIPKAAAHTTAVYTNRAPTAPYRGAGRPEATFAIERAVDLAARSIGMDPAELRRRNLLSPDQFPYTTPLRTVYDSGDYTAAFDRALAAADYAGWRARQARLRQEGRYLGIGLASFVEASVPAGWESGTVRVDRAGKVTLLTGSSSHGQGHHTTFAQVVADALGLPIGEVEVVHGDTLAVPVGVGTFGSRSTALGGSAAHVAAGRVAARMRQVAAHLLEASIDDVELADAHFRVAGAPARAISFASVASACYAPAGLPPGLSPGLEETEFFQAGQSYPFGTHVAIMEVDPRSGAVSILRYVAVDDCGTPVNPLLVAGQVHGGLAQGLGQALLEAVVYDENGQLASSSLMDYAAPHAAGLPRFELDSTITPSPLNPLGAKGVGEAGTVAAPAALVNAVLDALAPLGVTHLDMPLTPARVWEAIQAVTPEIVRAVDNPLA